MSGTLVLGELAHWLGMVNLDAVELDAPSAAVSFLYLGYLVVFIGSMIRVGMWIHRAHKRLEDAGFALEFTPGWAVGWYFVPLANFIMPFRAMKELWTVSHGEHDGIKGDDSALLARWWGAWLFGYIAPTVADPMLTSDSNGMVQAGFALNAIGLVVTAVSAVLLIRIIRTITSAHENGAMNAQVFE
ncbi:DUF4328 domain-containing protein [Altererythrobacter lutimaris]|uniref:DUF4328 domain-containing protein n=1 Tax=Altererythrobacter lutimaris TaxID=2743979 RepID=A0A850H8N3_9SPHN|nr:DUF4328 domain-containing protein [Altererythrobacter lutimaris]NVE93585.1 DUF4328 domain-containing protein [Altererythrobacter lutimaris]